MKKVYIEYKKCKICGMNFNRKNSGPTRERRSRFALRKFCSQKCMGRSYQGIKRSPETIEKLRLASLGRKFSDEVNAKKASKKEKNGRWLGGKLKCQKRQAKLRDDYTCQICGLRDPEIMEVDHIKPVCIAPHLIESLENLITLCPNCHRRRTNRFLREHYLGKRNEDR